MRIAGLPQRGHVIMVLSFTAVPVDRSSPRITAPARAAEGRTDRFPRAVRPSAAQAAGRAGLTGVRLDQLVRVRMESARSKAHGSGMAAWLMVAWLG
jgi:hypothetical protein